MEKEIEDHVYVKERTTPWGTLFPSSHPHTTTAVGWVMRCVYDLSRARCSVRGSCVVRPAFLNVSRSGDGVGFGMDAFKKLRTRRPTFTVKGDRMIQKGWRLKDTGLRGGDDDLRSPSSLLILHPWNTPPPPSLTDY